MALSPLMAVGIIRTNHTSRQAGTWLPPARVHAGQAKHMCREWIIHSVKVSLISGAYSKTFIQEETETVDKRQVSLGMTIDKLNATLTALVIDEGLKMQRTKFSHNLCISFC